MNNTKQYQKSLTNLSSANSNFDPMCLSPFSWYHNGREGKLDKKRRRRTTVSRGGHHIKMRTLTLAVGVT